MCVLVPVFKKKFSAGFCGGLRSLLAVCCFLLINDDAESVDVQTPSEWADHDANDILKRRTLQSHRRHPSLNGCLSFTTDVRLALLPSLSPALVVYGRSCVARAKRVLSLEKLAN